MVADALDEMAKHVVKCNRCRAVDPYPKHVTPCVHLQVPAIAVGRRWARYRQFSKDRQMEIPLPAENENGDKDNDIPW